MAYLDLLLNLSLLISLSIVSSFIDKKWPKHRLSGKLLQGLLFGGVAVIGMLRPVVMAPGIIFDGRTIMVSLAALFFGPVTALLSAGITMIARFSIGGVGMLTGILFIMTSMGIGLIAHHRLLPDKNPIGGFTLYYFGLVVHLVVVALMATLPKDVAIETLVSIGPYILFFFPLATVLAGSILSEHILVIQHVETLREREEFYSAVMGHLPVGIGVNTVLPEVTFSYMNAQFSKIYGVSEETLKDRNAFWNEVYEDPKFRERIRERVEEDVESGDPERMYWHEIPLKRNGKVFRYISARDTPIPGKDLMISLVWDVTERVIMQEQLIQSQKMETVGRLAGGIAHDFNNFLSVIFGYTEISLDGIESTDPLYGNLQEVLHAAERSKELVQQLLAFARKQTYVPQVVQLNDVVNSALNMLERLIGEEITFKFFPKQDLGVIKLDPAQIEQILTNLCVNARDAIFEGNNENGLIMIETDEISIGKEHHDTYVTRSPGEYVTISVADNGIGMDESTEEMIFEPFYTTKPDGKGSGLGLATVYGIVKQNNGHISVYSEPGEGTTFKLFFPKFLGEEEPQQKKEQQSSKIGQGQLILIIEDEQSILDIIQKMVGSLGYTTISARTPQEALALMQNYQNQIQLILTDVVLPGMNGRQLTEQLKAINPNLRVLYMSGYTANVIAHKGILDSGVNFIHKPFTKALLAAKIEEVLLGYDGDDEQ